MGILSRINKKLVKNINPKDIEQVISFFNFKKYIIYIEIT
jgi:hypothetical protein